MQETEFEEEAIEMYDEVIKTTVRNQEWFDNMDKLKRNTPQYHKMSQHNAHVKRNRKCPYCLFGSEPILDIEYELIIKNKGK